MLDRCLRPLTTNQTFCIKNCVFRVSCELIFGSISNKTFSFSSESNIRGCDTVSLVIGNDLNTSIFEDSDTDLRTNGQTVLFKHNINFKAYHEYVVPKSIPITVPTSLFLSSFSLASAMAAIASVSRHSTPNLMAKDFILIP